MSTNEKQPASPALPEDVLIILPVRDLVLFPGVVLPITLSGKRALAAAQEAVRTQRRVGLILQTEADADPAPESLPSGRHRRVDRPVHHGGRRHAPSDRPG